MAIIRKVAFCHHCNNRAPQTLIHSQAFEDRGYGIKDESIDYIPSTYHIASCDTCVVTRLIEIGEGEWGIF